MRSIWMPCLIAVLAAVAPDVQASRCVDQVANFARQLDVSIGAPGQNKITALNPELGPAPTVRGVPPVSPMGTEPPQGPMGSDKNVSVQPDDEESPTDVKPTGKAFKAHAKSVLSNLLNAALAAGEEGRSRACFEQLNVAHAVSLIVPQNDDDRGNSDGDWR